MDRPDKKSKQGKKIPRVPIKTYKWEDVRRARKRGGYPWTHLYKGPLGELIDSKKDQMADRKPKRHRVNIKETVEIQEISNGSEKSGDEIESQEIITEPDDHSNNEDIPKSEIVIEEIENGDDHKADVTVLESADSSDNISQYLDKEENVGSETKPEVVEKENIPEESQRKRKLSAESSYSKLSLTKMEILKKIQDTTQKLKIPKITLPVSKVRKHILKKGKSSPPQVKKEVVKKTTTVVAPGNVQPVYIHIPLKPPTGETDEFSYLEFGDKKPPPVPKGAKQPLKINPMFRDVLKNLKQMNDEEKKKEVEKSTDEKTTEGEASDKQSPEQENGAKVKEFDKLFAASSSTVQELEERENKRAKSAEPERKRKLSLESSYSRKSLSKLGIVKKIKEVTEKVKFATLNLPISKKKQKKEVVQEVKEEVKPQKLKISKNVEPQIIHIPLKPPEGTTDEFSYLEFESKVKVETKKAPSEDDAAQTSSLESPTSPKTDDVQFIFVTAPSDDEFLDKSPEIPETPAADTNKFFSGRIDELKEMAKNIADKYSPETKRKKLQAVKEENNSDKVQMEETLDLTLDLGEVDPEKLQVPVNQELKGDVSTTKILVDEEDGLKLSEIVEISKPDEKEEQKPPKKTKKGKGKGIKDKKPEKEVVEEMKTQIEQKTETETSPVFKKKVSFNKPTTTNSKEDIYEDIQISPSVDSATEKKDLKPAVEKPNLDEEKDIKNTSLEDDNNKWSKLGDHEYEPVNPPQNDVTVLANESPASVSVNVEPTRIKEASKTSSTTSLDRRMLGGTEENKEMTTELQRRLRQARVSEPFVPAYNELQMAAAVEERTNGTTASGSEPGKFQRTIKAKADELKTKIQGIKRPHINLPQAPKFQKPDLSKFKIERPKMPNLPKLPDTSKIKMPSFSLPRKGGSKRSLKQRQFSTESNAGDSKKPIFDFKTYPRIFKKKPKNEIHSSSGSSGRQVEFATVPRAKSTKEERKQTKSDRWGGRDSIRIPLHSEDSQEMTEDLTEKTTTQPSDTEADTREDSVERRMASHIRYDEDIDIDDEEMNEYERENQAINSASPYNQNFNTRWNHGSFTPKASKEYMENLKNAEYRVTDLDSPTEDAPSAQQSYTGGGSSKDKYSSEESSLGIRRRGVLEEINSDEFFLRQKGISQDNIDVGMYLSSEIREAFRTPNNALSDMQYERYPDLGSNQSLPETANKRKPVKKPKRRKTPHVSNEQVNYESEPEEYFEKSSPPARPKRRSKKTKKGKKNDVIPYQETITVDVDTPERETQVLSEQQLRNLNKTDDELNEEYRLMYENELMEGKENPDIQVTDTYRGIQYILDRYKSEEDNFVEGKPPAPPRRQKSTKSLESDQTSLLDEEHYIEDKPPAPPRRQKSLRSLSLSEHTSLADDFNYDREISIMNVETHSTLPRPEFAAREEIHEYIIPESKEPPKRPLRNRSRTRSRSRATSQQPDDDSLLGQESIMSDIQIPCIEESCVEVIRNCMGYATIDKQKTYEPPLPPPRTPPRSRRSTSARLSEEKFSTVPRVASVATPERPRRNYSTLTPKRKSLTSLEDKENMDIEQYIEIPEESNREHQLHSGEVIQKMRDRPLPAPPRPPRKTKILHDITSKENIFQDSTENLSKFDETEISTQTEPLPDDFVCEEPIHSETDRVLTPTIEPPKEESSDTVRIERRLITPTHYTHEETITHAALVVEPLNGARILPDSQLIKESRERIIPVEKESDYYDEDTSEIPESFHRLKSPETRKTEESTIKPPTKVIKPDISTEVEVLRAQKLQVSDLDVDRLTVNELMANKIVVSEIDSGSIQTSEINSRTGALKVGEIELPPGIVQELIEKIKAAVEEEQSAAAAAAAAQREKKDIEQKKTSIEEECLEIDQTTDISQPERPPRKVEVSNKSVEGSVENSSKPELIENYEIETHEEITESFADEDVEEELELELEQLEESDEQQVEDQMEEQVTEDTSLQSSEATQIAAVPIEESSGSEEPPKRPPRQTERQKTEESDVPSVEESEIAPPIPAKPVEHLQMQEPDIDDDPPPPRPPQPHVSYLPSQPPASFYALKAQKYVETLDENIPTVPRRRRAAKPPISRSSSEESVVIAPRNRHHRQPEPSIPQLTGQLARACGAVTNSTLKRLITYITNNVLGNADGKQDLNVMMVILLVLIAGLILLGYGDEKTVIHLHHWEFFNPPRDM